MKTQKTVLALALGLALATLAGTAQAVDKNWNCTNSTWQTSACWSPAGLPGSSDAVTVPTVSSANTVLKIDGTTGTANASGVLIDSTVSGKTVTLQQTGGTLATAGSVKVGNSSTGAYTQSAGSLSATSEWIGLSGSGTFTQSGGTNTVSSVLSVGDFSGSHGTYNLSGTGSLTVSVERIGSAGTGTFTQSGGTHTVNSDLVLGIYSGSNGSYTLSSGSLSSVSERFGSSGTGAFTQSGGTHTVDNNLTLGEYGGSNGTYTQSGGTLTVNGNIVNGSGSSTFNLHGGTLNVAGSLGLDYFNIGTSGPGCYTQSSGTHTVGTLTINNGSYTLAGGSLTVSTGLDNGGVFQLAGGTLTGGGALANNGLVSGYGTISGSGGFSNNGLVTQAGGHITLVNSGANANYGNMDLAGGYQLKLNGVMLSNSGTLNLNGALLTGTGTFANLAGGTVAGRGSITSDFSNAGMLAVTGGTLNISKAFGNSGVIEMTGPTSTLAGGAIGNSGTIQGHGNIGNAIVNNGSIDATGGALNLTGTVNNAAGGTLRASSGNKVLAVNGITSNAGLISLAGGTVDSNGTTLNSAGRIVGYGVLATGGLSNSGNMMLSGGTATVNGNVTNAVTGKIEVAYSPAVFTGDVVNYGQFKTTQTNVAFAGSYTEHGSFISDPSNNAFTDVVIAADGYWTGGAGDNFLISGNFENHSLQNTLWNTGAASLVLNGTAPQDLYLAGADLGASFAGYADNFAWGVLEIAPSQSLVFADGNASPGAALYVGEVTGVAISGGTVTNIDGNGFNLYYNPTLASNAYLGGMSYALTDGGLLAPAVPEPETWAMLLAGLGLVGVMARRRERAEA